jgi:hypothetical protein
VPLIHPRVVQRHVSPITVVPPGHQQILSAWSANLSKGLYDVETQNDSEFIQRILVDVLGYTGKGGGSDWTLAKNIPIGKGNVDVALGEFHPDSTRILAPFELKGASTQDLDAIMPGRNKSPVQQAWEYAMDAKGAQWVLVSNYREIRLYAVGYGRKDYESFDLTELLKDHREYARFVLLLSAESLIRGRTRQLLKETEDKDRDITTKLYQDYKKLRSQLIAGLIVDNPTRDPVTLIQDSQTILDRVLFVAFAEDKGLLAPHALRAAFETQNPFSPQPIWANFKGLFHSINVGNTSLDIPPYNGGLFAPNAAVDQLTVSDELCKGFKCPRMLTLTSLSKS